MVDRTWYVCLGGKDDDDDDDDDDVEEEDDKDDDEGIGGVVEWPLDVVIDDDDDDDGVSWSWFVMECFIGVGACVGVFMEAGASSITTWLQLLVKMSEQQYQEYHSK